MKTDRRKFLALLGIGAASAPLAAKTALDEEVVKQVGLNTTSFVGGAPSMSGLGNSAPMSAPTSSTSYQQALNKSSAYVKLMGLPKGLEKEFRQRAQYIHALDPDIAVKRSWSMSVKLMTQRERNYQRQIEALHSTADYYNLRDKLAQMLGFQWPH